MSTTLEAQKQAERLADDLLFGARAIAEELGVEVHAVYYIAKTGRLPIGRIGKRGPLYARLNCRIGRAAPSAGHLSLSQFHR